MMNTIQIKHDRRQGLAAAGSPYQHFSLRRLALAMACLFSLALLAGSPPGFAGPEASAAEAAPAIVNINTADATTLATGLKGVGQSRAEAIVRYREAYGPFASPDELADVKGIGQSTLDMNRARIILE